MFNIITLISSLIIFKRPDSSVDRYIVAKPKAIYFYFLIWRVWDKECSIVSKNNKW